MLSLLLHPGSILQESLPCARDLEFMEVAKDIDTDLGLWMSLCLGAWVMMESV